MFGYIRACQPELKVRELDAYKAVYCGLCHELGRSFGPLARLMLSYDFTFLAMLYCTVNGAEPQTAQRSCMAHPFCSRAAVCSCDALQYSARVAVLMLRHKLLDDLADGDWKHRLRARLLLLLSRPAYRYAADALPALSVEIARQMARQSQIEADPAAGVDLACEPTALSLEAVFRELSDKPGTKRILARMGYLLGRYVYLADALDDLEEDRRIGGFNPFRGCTREDAAASLRLTVGELGAAYDLLERGAYSPITDNILYLGLRMTVQEIQKPRAQRSVTP